MCNDISAELTKCIKFKKVGNERVTPALAKQLYSKAASSLTELMELSKMLKSMTAKL